MRRHVEPVKEPLKEELQDLWDAIRRLREGMGGVVSTEDVGDLVGPPGPQGVAGPSGPQGPVGPAGQDGEDAPSYTFTQTAPAAVWVINHNLNRHPQVTVVDTAGTVVEGSIFYDSTSTITITFTAPFSGKAYLGG